MNLHPNRPLYYIYCVSFFLLTTFSCLIYNRALFPYVCMCIVLNLSYSFLYTDDCGNSTMLSRYRLDCDGIYDCADGQDEKNCCKHV